ncbi:probable WRKY transcription factor 70 [Tanacetum coccineum]
MESSIWPESVPSNNIQAIQALTEGQEMINILCEMLFRPKKIDSTGPISEDGLVVRIQGMFENTLSIMSSCSSNESIQLMTSDVHSPCSSDEEKLKYSDIHKTITPAKIKRGRCYKKSKNTWTSTQITSVLADDGHAWRKYGQKQILNSKHQRNYYRCTYKFDQGCLATKQVQQIQDSPPKYKTIYSGDHTCKNLQRAPAIVLDFPEPRDTSLHLISFENKGYIENIHAEPNFPSIKQELKEGFPLAGSFRHNEPSFSNNYLSVDYQNTCISRRPLEQISMTPFGHGGIISSNAYSYTASTDGHGIEVDTSEDFKELMESKIGLLGARLVFRCSSGLVGMEISCLGFFLGFLELVEGLGLEDLCFVIGFGFGGLFMIDGVCKEYWFIKLSVVDGDKPPKNKESLIGLDEVYVPLSSIILTTNPIPDVKGDFATLSRDESHKSTQSHNMSKSGNGNTAVVARTNQRKNNCLLVILPILKNTSTNRGSSSNNAISENKDQCAGSSNSFIDDQYKRLTALISEKSSSSSMLANIAGTENTGDATRDDVGHPDDNTSAEAYCDNLESAILDEKGGESEGDDTSY